MELEELAFRTIKKLFSQKTRDKLKLIHYNFKDKLAPWKKRYHGTFNIDDLNLEIVKRIPDDFEILMVHSSHAGLLPMFQGSMKQVLETLLRLCGDDKTLAMPAFFFGDSQYHYDVIKYFDDHPDFYLDDVPSQMGLLTELFRNHPGVQVSRHPTHRIAAHGPKASELVADHESCKLSCGIRSPFHKMANMRTLILGLGVKSYQSLTQPHCPEHILIEKGQHPFQYRIPDVKVVMWDGSNISIAYNLSVPIKVGKHFSPTVDSKITEWTFHGVPLYFCWANTIQMAMLGGYQKMVKEAI